MDFTQEHFFWGLGVGLLLGLIGIVLAILRLWETRREVSRLRRHLADKMELEADATNRLKADLQNLKSQNENLRMKVSGLSQLPDRKQQRDLEVYARAERYMVSQSPGFPAVWEQAKQAAVGELETEEQGHSLPRRVFHALLNRSSKNEDRERQPQAET
jgi:hypothetical protein